MPGNFELISAVWVKRPKTKFLQLKLNILLHQTDAVVTAEPAVPQGLNETILLVDVKVEPGKGPMKGVMTIVEPPAIMTTGIELWTHVQATHDGVQDTVEITVLEGAASTKGVGGTAGGSKLTDGHDDNFG